MDKIWILSLASRDFHQHRSWPVSAYLSEASAREAMPALEAEIARIRANAQARASFLKAWEANNPRPSEALLAAPGNPYRARHQAPEMMTAHGRAADAAWLAARHKAMAEAGLLCSAEIPLPLRLVEHLLDAHVEISSLPLYV